MAIVQMQTSLYTILDLKMKLTSPKMGMLNSKQEPFHDQLLTITHNDSMLMDKSHKLRLFSLDGWSTDFVSSKNHIPKATSPDAFVLLAAPPKSKLSTPKAAFQASEAFVRILTEAYLPWKGPQKKHNFAFGGGKFGLNSDKNLMTSGDHS